MTEFKKVQASRLSLAQRTLVCGVGVNDAWYTTNPTKNGIKTICPAYKAWVSMLVRCYSDKCKAVQPTYEGVTVCSEWLTFSVFSEWHEANCVVGYDLDKDIKSKNSKMYSPNNCLYVPKDINRLFTDRANYRGNLPLGVGHRRAGDKYRAYVNRDGKGVKLGMFDTPEEAHLAYKIGKNESIRLVMLKYPEFTQYLEQYIYEI